MNRFYEKQNDGSLKPLEIPSNIVKGVGIYLWLKAQALTFEEAKFILTDPEIKYYSGESK